MRLKGFTLVELVVAVALIGILASAIVPVVKMSAQKQREEELRRALREIRMAIDAYKRASDDGVVQRMADESGYPPSLGILVDGVRNIKDPKGRKVFFLRRIPDDPFRAGMYDSRKWGLRSYESDAAAPKEGRDVYDVYSLSAAVGSNGRPYREW